MTPKRDARVMVFSGDGDGPGERVKVIRRIGDGKLEIDGETIALPDIAGRGRARPAHRRCSPSPTTASRGRTSNAA